MLRLIVVIGALGCADEKGERDTGDGGDGAGEISRHYDTLRVYRTEGLCPQTAFASNIAGWTVYAQLGNAWLHHPNAYRDVDSGQIVAPCGINMSSDAVFDVAIEVREPH